MNSTEPDAAAPKPRRYRGRMPEERRAQRRRKLLDTGLDLFATAGYANTSVEKICSTSGVTGRHFYEEFTSREALLMAVYDDIMTTAYEQVQASVADAPLQLTVRLDAGLSAYMHVLLDDPRRARVIAVEAIGIGADFERHRRRTAAAFADFIRGEAEALEAEGAKFEGNELTVFALVAAVHELTAAWLALDEPITIDELAAEAVRIITAVAVTSPPPH